MALDSQTKITLIIDWSLSHKNKGKRFSPQFAYDMQERLDMGYELTREQERSLENIIIKWKMMGR